MNNTQWIVMTLGLLALWSTHAVSPVSQEPVVVKDSSCVWAEKAASRAILQSLVWYGFLFTEEEKIKQEEYAGALTRERTAAARSDLSRQRMVFWTERENIEKKRAADWFQKQNKADAFLKSEQLWARYEQAALSALAFTSAAATAAASSSTAQGASQNGNSPRFLLVNEHLKRSHCAILHRLSGGKSMPSFPEDLPESSQNIKLLAVILMEQSKKELSAADFDLWCKEMKKLLPAWSDYMEFVVDIHPDSSEFTDGFCLEMRVLLKSLLISEKKG